jgi:uncharacterized protein (TIGR00369 family)
MSRDSVLDFHRLVAANASAAFNRLAGFQVISAQGGTAEIRMAWSDDLTQYAGHLHAGVIAALLDTVCGFAASTVAGRVTASHFSMNCLKPAVGRRFIAKGVTLRAGRRQIFSSAELFAEDGNDERTLVATGETLLVSLEV